MLMCKSKIYHVSSPFEVPNSGDYDYGAAIINKLCESEYDAEYLTLDSIDLSQNCKDAIDQLLQQFKTLNSVEFWQEFTNWSSNTLRTDIVKLMLDFIISDVQKNNIELPILNLQLRPLETGLLFVPNDLVRFKEQKIKVNVTCHEYKLNETRPIFQAILHQYFIEADTVSFFNLSDLTKASKHANHRAFNFSALSGERQQEWIDLGDHKFKEWRACFQHEAYNLVKKMILTRVPPTISSDETNYELFLQKKPNILVFGTIRQCKGVEEAIDIAKVLKSKQSSSAEDFVLKDTRVIIIGNPIGGDAGTQLILNLIKKRFDFKVFKNVLNVTCKQEFLNRIKQIINDNDLKKNIELFEKNELEHNIKELLPIDIKIGCDAAEIRVLCNNTRYAIKYDNKGWANNASSHISCLANGCIVYTGWGMNTSREVVDGGKYQDAIVFLAKKYGLKDGEKLTLKQKMDREQQKHYQIKDTLVPNNKDPVTAEKVLADIINRESANHKVGDMEEMPSESVVDDSILSREFKTLADMNQKSFESAKNLILEFTTLVGRSFGGCLTDVNERVKQYDQQYVRAKLIKDDYVAVQHLVSVTYALTIDDSVATHSEAQVIEQNDQDTDGNRTSVDLVGVQKAYTVGPGLDELD